MRTATITLALLGTLALSSCASTPAPENSPSASASTATEIRDCSPLLKSQLDAAAYDLDKCWTVADEATKAIVQGGTVFHVAGRQGSSAKRLVARSSDTGEKRWESADFTDIDPAVASGKFEIRNFRVDGKSAVAVGYTSTDKGAYRVVVFDAATGDQLITQEAPSTGGAVAVPTWGADAVAVTRGADSVSVLTGKSRKFTAVPTVPWQTGDATMASTPGPAARILYVTDSRLVLDQAEGATGVTVADLSGTTVGSIATGTRTPTMAFCGAAALVDRQDGSPAAWVSLADGSPMTKPNCAAGDYFTTQAFDQAVTVRSLGDGFVSPDGRTVAVGNAAVYALPDGPVTPVKAGASTYFGLSNIKAFGPDFVQNIGTGEVAKNQNVATGVGVSVVGGQEYAVFTGSWGIGGAPTK